MGLTHWRGRGSHHSSPEGRGEGCCKSCLRWRWRRRGGRELRVRGSVGCLLLSFVLIHAGCAQEACELWGGVTVFMAFISDDWHVVRQSLCDEKTFLQLNWEDFPSVSHGLLTTNAQQQSHENTEGEGWPQMFLRHRWLARLLTCTFLTYLWEWMLIPKWHKF